MQYHSAVVSPTFSFTFLDTLHSTILVAMQIAFDYQFTQSVSVLTTNTSFKSHPERVAPV